MTDYFRIPSPFSIQGIFGMTDNTQRRKIAIKHSKADEVSVIWGDGTHSDEGTREIAFFKDGDWVIDMPAFNDYKDGDYTGSMVFNYVPIALLETFLDEYAIGEYSI